MNDRIFIKPALQADGTAYKVRKPMNGHLSDQGEWVNTDSYWLRRLADGDVVDATSDLPDTAQKPASGKAGSKQA